MDSVSADQTITGREVVEHLAVRDKMRLRLLRKMQNTPVLLMPVSGELPFRDGLDRRDDASFARVWRAQMPQIGIPFMGLPGLTVSTGLVGRTPVGVQVVSGRYREEHRCSQHLQ